MSEVEQALYQVKNRSGQDPLNFPIRLNNRLAALGRSIETGDAKPTDGAYAVFKDLSNELQGHLTKLDELLGTDLSALNEKLKAENLEPVSPKPKK
jgi:hypothetical protein